MHPEDPSFHADDQCSVDVADFILTSIPDSSIKLLQPRPEKESTLARQLNVLRQIELLRRCADPAAAGSSSNRTPSPSSSQPAFLQDVILAGQTSIGETVYLVLSVVVEPPRWQGGWFLAVLPPHDSERFQAYLADAREAIVAQLQQQAGVEL
jgi:hypothetical protein